ncbi:Protein of unknown function [Gryllus bimaculatus]|nr:Protein of unknown function [Gryllus bimaculatus]
MLHVTKSVCQREVPAEVSKGLFRSRASQESWMEGSGAGAGEDEAAPVFNRDEMIAGLRADKARAYRFMVQILDLANRQILSVERWEESLIVAVGAVGAGLGGVRMEFKDEVKRVEGFVRKGRKGA